MSVQGFIDPLVIESYERIVTEELGKRRELVENVLTRSNNFAQGKTSRDPDPRRNIYDECGLPTTANITPELLQELYNRNAIAGRVVELWPYECWQKYPEIYEDEDEKVTTEFEQALKDLPKYLNVEQSHFEMQEGNPVLETLVRADIMAGLGKYGVIYIGTSDTNSSNISEPLEDMEYGRRYLTTLAVLPESQATVTRVDTNINSPRYGMPEQYNLTFYDPTDTINTVQGATGYVGQTHTVHWTRIVHIADGVSTNKVIGVSRLRPVLDYLLALDKIYPGSAEMYWRNSSPGLSLETHPQLGGDVAYNRSKMRSQMEQYMNGLQKYLVLTGMSAKTLAPNVTDPTPYVKTLLEAIAIKLGVPMRIFMGSERGELSSSQDTGEWIGRVQHRNQNYTTPRIVVPFIDRLINKGLLPRPSKYFVDWPELTTKDAGKEVDNNSKRVTSFVAYINSPMKDMVSPIDYLTRYDTFTKEEAEQIIENGLEYARQQMEAQQIQQPVEQPVEQPIEEIEELPYEEEQTEEQGTDGGSDSRESDQTNEV